MKKLYSTMCVLVVSLACQAQITLEQPETKIATNITSSAFTANWGAVENADGYCVFVYDRQQVTADGEVTIADEDFSGITSGSINEPEGGDEEYVDLSAYGYATSYGWSAYAFPNYIPSMVAGLIYSPYMDLRGNDGKYKVIVSAYCSNGDEIRLETHGSEGKVIHTAKAVVDNGGTGIADITFELEDGSKDLFFSVINNTAKDGAPDYFDRIQVKQNLKKGDFVNLMVGGNEAIDATSETNGDSITSCRIQAPTRYTASKVVYYDCYASANDFTTPNGSIPYTFVVSPFTKLVKVDMTKRTSEIVDETSGITISTTEQDTNNKPSAVYNLTGQQVKRSMTKGIMISKGKKFIVK